MIELILLLNFHQSRRKLLKVQILGLLAHLCFACWAFGATILLVLGGHRDRLAYYPRNYKQLSCRFEFLQRPVSKFANLFINFFSRQISSPLA